MNKTSTLRGIMLDTYWISTLTSRRLFTAFCNREGACRVPTIGLCPWTKQVPEPEVAEQSRSIEGPQSRVY